MATKLWDKGFEPDKMIEEYTVGNDRELDMRLARYDVQGSLAHIAMLETIGLLTAGELEKLTAGLKEIAAEIEAGRFEIEPGTEDVHSQVELMLTRRLGDAGKKIHSGRSRNDQVLVDLKLFLRDELRQTAEAVKTVFDRLQTLSEQYKEILMPGYTHLQIAMPSSFGLWFGAYAETLVDDMRLIAAAWHIANQNPLGSAAGYGSSFPLDREMTTRLLGFEALQRRGGTDEPRQKRTHRRQRHRGRRCDHRPPGDGHLPVHEPELRLRIAARQPHHGVEHHAPQEEPRRLRDHARTL